MISSFFRLPGYWGRRQIRRNRMATLSAIILLLLLVVLPLFMIYAPPVFAINKFQRQFPQVLFHVQTERKIVALTIDDTPSEFTPEILAILRESGASATFFTIGGQVPGREGLLRDVLRGGSELGNHAMHDEPSIKVDSATLLSEIKTVDTLIDSAYSTVGQTRKHHFFRPGSGVFSSRLLGVAEDAGHKMILGSIFPHDPFISWWRINAWHVLARLRPGAVIICHDRRSWTVPMLKRVVPEMRKRGYEVVSVGKFLEAVGGE